MKTLQQVQDSTFGDVFTTEEFIEHIRTGLFTNYDGVGCFHDGNHEADDEVDCSDLEYMLEMKDQYPYVIWYNK